MARHRTYAEGAGQAGRAGRVPAAGDRSVSTGPNPRAGIETADEPFGGPDRAEFEPRGAGEEATTAIQSFQTLLDFSPARGETYLVDEVAVALESNGAAVISLNGDLYGEFTGQVEVSVPFRGGKLPYGGHIRVLHRSTDGADTTTKAFVSGREV